MSLIAVLSSPNAAKMYAFGDGNGSVCDFGTSDLTSLKLIITEGRNFTIQKSNAFTVDKITDGDPILITGGSLLMCGIYTARRINDSNILLVDANQQSVPFQSLNFVVSPTGNPANNDTITYTPPTWSGLAAVTYRFRDVNNVLGGGAQPFTQANDILIGADLLTSVRNLVRAINQVPTVNINYSTNTVGLQLVSAQPAGSQDANTALLTLQTRMVYPQAYGVTVFPYGIITSAITGGGVAQSLWSRPDVSQLNAQLPISGDINLRQPAQLGNKGNRVGRGRLMGAMALAGGAADVKITCYSAGYISDSAGAGVLPRADYFQGFGNIPPQAISLPIGTYIPFGPEEDGLTIARAGFLFNISGTTPVVAVYFEDQ